MQVSAILLAAGNGTRFGGNKLMEPIEGMPLYEHTVKKVLSVSFAQVIVVTQYLEISASLEGLPVKVVVNPNPTQGISSSIQCALRHCAPCDGLMFFVCDQPYLKQETIVGMLACFQQNANLIISAAYGNRRGNPVIFPYSYYKELMKLTGDCGGSALFSRHKEAVRLYSVTHPSELVDIDRKSDVK